MVFHAIQATFQYQSALLYSKRCHGMLRSPVVCEALFFRCYLY